MQPEAQFKSALRRSFKRQYPTGLWTHIVKGPGMIAGMPDLLVGSAGVVGGWHIYLEAKIGTLQVRPTQAKTFTRMAQANIPIIVVAKFDHGALRAYRWRTPADEAQLCPHYLDPNFWQHLLRLH